MLLQTVIAQFRQPRGLLGRVAGWIMATRPSNIARNRWTVEQLELSAAHRVLEIGYGPGYAVSLVAAQLVDGRVDGIDHSALMWRDASRRNAAAIADGKVHLLHGDADLLNTMSGPYDRVYSANVAQFWSNRVDVFTRIKRLLTPGGRLVTTYQPRGRGVSDADAMKFGEQLLAEMRAAGFAHVELRQGPRVGVLTVAAVGQV